MRNSSTTIHAAQQTATQETAPSSDSNMQLSVPTRLTLWQHLYEDARIIPEKDPATPSILYAICFTPGLWAIWIYRIAHLLWALDLHFVARVLSTIARIITAIEIHPAAVIGRRFSIDHGTGVVIGETCIVGDDVLLFQGVTLGGTGKELGKRHPSLGSNVVVGSGAKVLGNIRISDGAKIGAGSVVVKDVPINSTVIGVPGRVIQKASAPETHKEKYPDIDAHAIRALFERLQTMEADLLRVKANETTNKLIKVQEDEEPAAAPKLQTPLSAKTQAQLVSESYLQLVVNSGAGNDSFTDGDGI